MKQAYQVRLWHAHVWSGELPQHPSNGQSPAQHSADVSTRTHTHPRERPPSTTSKTEERPGWPTARQTNRQSKTTTGTDQAVTPIKKDRSTITMTAFYN